ncbi:hypothetical protein PybrP1_004241 [[Pythium] brassicae (nom. inval.)]|nr:hypothetical protein PybrP1_004241 [[Pythium] brassicae (nom. inval.)]
MLRCTLRQFSATIQCRRNRAPVLARCMGSSRPRNGEFSDVLHFETLQPRGGVLTPAELAGKALLVVNTASQCDLAVPQLQQLQQLHERFAARGLVVVAVPSDDFGAREPGDDDAILQRYTAPAFGVRFPIARKTPVTGDAAHDFFERIVVEYSRSVAPTYALLARLLALCEAGGWNFDKFLIDHRGDLRAVFPHDTQPLVPQVLEAIEEVLEELSRPPSADDSDDEYDDEYDELDDEDDEDDDEEDDEEEDEEEDEKRGAEPRVTT